MHTDTILLYILMTVYFSLIILYKNRFLLSRFIEILSILQWGLVCYFATHLETINNILSYGILIILIFLTILLLKNYENINTNNSNINANFNNNFDNINFNNHIFQNILNPL